MSIEPTFQGEVKRSKDWRRDERRAEARRAKEQAQIGRVFGRLTIIGPAPKPNPSHKAWLCRCECGTEKAIGQQPLFEGITKSCGCLQREIAALVAPENCTTHGRSGTLVYAVWSTMKARCYNANNSNYANYGERGITVCDRWKNSFENFIADMGERPNGMTLERIDVNGNYEPSNCKWASWSEQRINQRRMK